MAAAWAFAPIAAGGAAAHAGFVRSAPVAESALDQPPARVTIWFTEPLDRDYSRIEVLNALGGRVDNGDTTVDPSDATAMSVTLRPLANGTYTVAWRNLSTVDGHSVRGSYVFSVGELVAEQPVAAPDEPLIQSPAEPFLRWGVLLGIMAIVGGAGFSALVTAPALLGTKSPQRMRRLGRLLLDRTTALVWAGVFLLLVSSVAQLLVQAGNARDVSPLAALFGPAFSFAAGTEWGNNWLLRVVFVCGIAVALAATGRLPFVMRSPTTSKAASADREGLGRLAVLLLGAGVLMTISRTSHAAATAGISGPAIATDYIHLVASALWVGGLFHFALAAHAILRDMQGQNRRAAVSAMMPRFSAIAVLATGTLIITGLYSAWAQVTVIPALQAPYGLTLVAKVALVAGMLALGALNLLWVRPRLKRDDGAPGLLRRAVMAEAAIGVVVLISVGFLTSLEPARQVASREGLGGPGSLKYRETVEGTAIDIEVGPGRVGRNTVAVRLADTLGNPVDNASLVNVRVAYPGADLGEEFAQARNAGGGEYVLDGRIISIAGAWQVEVEVVRPGAFDARTAYGFEISAGSTAGGSAEITPDPETGVALFGLELIGLGVLFLVVGLPLGGWYSKTGVAVMGPGIASFMVGAVMLFNTQFAASPEALPEKNPIAPSAESIAAGRAIYTRNCLICHGESGRGDGPQAALLNPPPLDLTVHVPLHPERDVFRFIHDGMPGTAMVGFGDQLTDEEIWHVVNYIKTLD